MRQLLRVTSIFALALVFTAGMAFGQSPSSTNNFSVIDQVDNSPSYSQSNGKATVKQAGENNISRINQVNDILKVYNGLGGGGLGIGNMSQLGRQHEATVEMLGNRNISNIVQNVSGTGHSEVTIGMDGNDNKVSNGFSNRNPVRLKGNSDLDVNILGSDNRAEFGGVPTLQSVENANVSITVDGDGNRISAGSGAAFAGPESLNENTIRVLGGENRIISQQGFGGVVSGNNDHYSSVDVDGSYNSVTVQQGTEAAGGSSITFDEVNQGSLLNSGFAN